MPLIKSDDTNQKMARFVQGQVVRNVLTGAMEGNFKVLPENPVGEFPTGAAARGLRLFGRDLGRKIGQLSVLEFEDYNPSAREMNY